jgi:hypothetical protein
VEVEDGKLALTWFHRIDDAAITRLMTPQPLRPQKDPNPPKPEVWRPKVDWLYRQYVVGVGEKAAEAELALRDVLGAAAGWIDRPITQEQVAVRLVAMMARLSARNSAEIGLLKVVPPLLADDKAGVKEALRTTRDQVERTDFYINLINDWVARGAGREVPAAGGREVVRDDHVGQSQVDVALVADAAAAALGCVTRLSDSVLDRETLHDDREQRGSRKTRSRWLPSRPRRCLSGQR